MRIAWAGRAVVARGSAMNSLTWHDFAYVFWPVIYRGSFSTVLWWGAWPLLVAAAVLLADRYWPR